jgi:carbon storage regulator
MLVLSRKPGEKIIIGSGITLTVVEVRGDRVRLAVDAPPDVRILRSELAWWQDSARNAEREHLRHEQLQAFSHWNRPSRPRFSQLSARSAHGATRRANEHNKQHVGSQRRGHESSQKV